MDRFGFTYSALHKVAVSLILGITLPMTAIAQCDECIDKRIMLFDAAVNVSAPPDTAIQEVYAWCSLFELSRKARYSSHWEDPSRDCFYWIDGGLWLANSAQGGTFKFGSTYSNLPPAGPVDAAAYILTGSITPTGTKHLYTFTWQLECGTSREVVRSSTVTYSTDSSLAWLGEVGRQAAAGLQPLHQVIHEFEVQKRDEDVGVARSGLSSIKVTPEKKELQPNDSTRVGLELIDQCDGYILKNREIILEPYTDPETGERLCNGPSGGTVRPTRVTTDENGKATVMFIAGSQGGLGIINAVYPFKKPHGWADAIFGEASINLTNSMWDVRVECEHSASSTTDMTSTEGGTTTVSTGDGYFHVDAKMSFVYENKDPGNVGDGKLIVSAPNDPAAGIVYGLSFIGNYQEGGMTRIEKRDEDGSIVAFYSSRTTLSSRGCRSLESGLNFDGLRDGLSVFQLSGTIKRMGSTQVNISGFPDSEPIQIDEFFSVLNVMFLSVEAQAHFGFDGSNYTANYVKSVTTNEPGTSSSYTIKVHAQFNGKNQPASVNDNSSSNVPRDFVLYQNYPNPFNPSTTIKYALPVDTRVSIIIYNLLGQEVTRLIYGLQKAGYHHVTWVADNVPSGVYFCRMRAGNFLDTKKFLLLR